jgi:hypothetical protein
MPSLWALFISHFENFHMIWSYMFYINLLLQSHLKRLLSSLITYLLERRGWAEIRGRKC